MSSLPTAEQDPVEFAAAEWIVRLGQSKVSVEEVAEWQQWMRLDERHALAFRRLEALWHKFDAVTDSSKGSSTRALAKDAYDGAMPVSDWLRSARVPRQPPRWALRILSAAACALILTTIGIALYGDGQRPPELAHQMIETAVGENRSITLADGSSVKLGGRSRLSFSLRPLLRDVVLERGEAFFTVAKDPSRPFEVHAGNATVTAVGTQFDVHRSDDRVTVAVLEGKVMVQSMAPLVPVPWFSAVKPVGRASPLTAGERTTINQNGVEPAQLVATGPALDWQQGRLAFEGESLRYVVEDVNRYTAKPIVIADDRTAALRVTGTILSSNVMGWVMSLKSAFDINAEVQSDRIILRKE